MKFLRLSFILVFAFCNGFGQNNIYSLPIANFQPNEIQFKTPNNNWSTKNQQDPTDFLKNDYSYPRFIAKDNGATGISIGITKSYTITGDITLPNIYNALINNYATFSETTGGASTIIGNNVRAGIGNNTVYRNVVAADNASFIQLNYHNGISFHTAVNSPINEETSSYNYEKMRLTQSGNLGLGITNPNEKLEVNGKIRAKEVKVETSGWPDYVFKPSYNNMPLAELEKFIQKNNHLPEIPSALEAETNGIELGEMNKLLLKKIEELTLHIINQNQRIEKLEAILPKK